MHQCIPPKQSHGDGVHHILEDDRMQMATHVADANDPCVVQPILLQATSPGLKPSLISIQTSVDDADGVLAVAQLMAGQPVYIN